MPCCTGTKVAESLCESTEIIELLPNERGFDNETMVGLQDGIMLASLYKLNSGANFDSVKQKILDRMNRILEANNWMMGRLRHVGVKGSTDDPYRFALTLQKKFFNLSDYVVRDVNDEVFEEPLKYGNIRKISRKFTIGNAKKIWDNDAGRYSQFGLIENSDKTRMCVFLEGSHVVFDGTTLYMLWKMLDENEEIRALNPVRVQSFVEDMKKHTSILPSECTFKGYYDLIGKRMFPAMMRKGLAQDFKRCKTKQFLYKFDQREIAKEKAKFKAEDFFVSSNDIVTAFMQDLVPKMDNVMLAVSCRGRVPNITESMPGNYLTAPIIKTDDMKDAASVRTWLQKTLSPNHDYKMPSYADFKRYIGGIATNWSAFYHHLEPEGLTQMFHCPVFADVNFKIGPFSLGTELGMITFVPNKGELACFMFTRRKEITSEFLEKQTLISEKLMSF